jgi:hypothetical protein
MRKAGFWLPALPFGELFTLGRTYVIYFHVPVLGGGRLALSITFEQGGRYGVFYQDN